MPDSARIRRPSTAGLARAALRRSGEALERIGVLRLLRLLLALPLALAAGRRARTLRLVPQQQLVALDDDGRHWRAVDSDPQFLVPRALWRAPRGWCSLRTRVVTGAVPGCAKLYLDTGRGYSEALRAVAPPASRDGDIDMTVYLPLSLRRMRWDPLEIAGEFEQGALTLCPLGLRANLGLGRRALARALRSRAALLRAVVRARLPIPAAAGRAVARGAIDYPELLRRIEPPRERIAARAQRLQGPLVSVVMPVFNTPLRFLRAAIESVQAQTYPRWELCIADDASTQEAVRTLLAEYARRDSRIRVVFRDTNGGIAAATNSALEAASGEFIAFLDHDDALDSLALYHVADAVARDPDLDLVYTDEDKITEDGQRYDPHFKPDWNPELLWSINYFGHLVAIRRSLVKRVGGLRPGFDGSQDYDLVLRCVAATSAEHIRHIPAVLYHWRAIPGSTAGKLGAKPQAHVSGVAALRAAFAGEPGGRIEDGPFETSYRVVFPVPDPPPSVDIIIPTRDGLPHLRNCADSIRRHTAYPRLRLVIVDNQSRDDATLRYFESLSREGTATVLRYDRPFNFSAINNFAAARSQADLLLFLNDDVEVTAPGWLEEMVSRLARPGVGAVGAKLFYPDGRVQHAGVILGIGGVAGHSHKYFPGNDYGYMGRLALPQALSAVTGACLLMRRDTFRSLGGFDEINLPIAFNDIDLCLRLGAAGYRCVWTPYAAMIHHESVSRGHEDTPEKVARFAGEVRFMQQRWGGRLLADPYYSRYLTLQREDFSLSATATPYVTD